MITPAATDKNTSRSARKAPISGLFGLRSPWKTCGKPVGQTLEPLELSGGFRGRIGVGNRDQNHPLNNRGQLTRFRRVIHSQKTFIHSRTVDVTIFCSDTYDKQGSYCPPGMPPLKITNGLKLKGLVNNVAPLLNPTNP